MATAVGVLGAVVGLIATACATYFDARVAQDQLDQSREDAQREIRDQATRVTYWVEGTGAIGSPRRIHLVNRSPDPVTHVETYIRIELSGKSLVWARLQTDMGPCSQVGYSEEDMKVGNPRIGRHWTPLRPLGLFDWQVAYEGFLDRDGKAWKRTATGLTEWNRAKSPGEPRVVVSDSNPTGKKFAQCGEGAS
ncbi:hypothetical protein [Streptomyces cyanogenus]|uniref:hypothetical protein n=1 Tax=Streptomyces cyanogenus TaxID=80860 RepID=UPI001AA0D6CB|nr:hypothetical protein [Streptomyces cyanogenus]